MNLREAEYVEISDIVVGARIRQALGDVNELANSINDIGQLVPVLIDENNFLIDGQRRIKACQLLGMKQIKAVRIKMGMDTSKAEYEANARRLQFTPSEAVRAAEAIERAERLKAIERRNEGRPKEKYKASKVEESSTSIKGKTKDIVAAKVGMSGKTLEKAQKVVQKAESNPEVFGDLVTRMDNKGVDGAYKEMQKREQSDNPEAQTPTIIIDGTKYPIEYLKGEKFPLLWQMIRSLGNGANENHLKIQDGESYKITRIGFNLMIFNVTGKKDGKVED